MPRAEIASKQALYTLGQLHSELAGKLLANQREAKRLRTSMLQVEAVMKMLDPAVNLRLIAPKRRNTGNPWFKRGTLFRSAVDVLRRAQGSHDGAGHCRGPDSRQGTPSHTQASQRPTGGYPCRATKAEWWYSGWRRRAAAVETERGRQLRRPTFARGDCVHE
jgi:hypothetical protein